MSDIGEDEIDDELALPDVLRTIDYDEKRELYRFKQTHNEVSFVTIYTYIYIYIYIYMYSSFFLFICIYLVNHNHAMQLLCIFFID